MTFRLTRRFRHAALGLATLAMLGASAGCGGDDSGSSGGASTTISVSSTADQCVVSASSAPSGKVVFEVTNDGSEVTEFYLYDEAGTKVIGEVENIGPGLTRDLSADLDAGTYNTACKPGMQGDGIRAPFKVTSTSPTQ